MSERKKSRYEGLAIAAAFWWWGSLAWFAPIYIGIEGLGWWVLNIVGGVLVAIAFAGAAIEVGKLWKNEAFGYWGVGLLFLVPAGLLHALAEFMALPSTWTAVAKSAVLLLAALGGTFFLMGIPYFFSESLNQSKLDTELSPEEEAEVRAERRSTRREIAGSAGLLLLTVISAILKVVLGIG